MLFFVIIPHLAFSKHFTIGTSTSISCASYSCSRVPGPYCLGSGQSNTFYASACPSGTYCSKEGLCTSTKEKYEDIQAFPGENCNTLTQCKFGTCEEGLCKGKPLGDLCKEHAECAVGLRCHNTCKKLFNKGERGCITDLDCTLNTGCNYGECTQYFTVKPNEKIEKCELNSNYLCKSAMCDKGKCLEEQFAKEYPKECISDYECQSNGGFFTGCMCGMNPNGKSYCLPFPGDSIGKEYFHLLDQWINSHSIHKCNTARRFALHCMNSHWKQCHLLEYIYRVYRYQFFPTIIDNPICVEQSLTQDYWEIRDIYKKASKESDCKFPYKLNNVIY